MEYNEFVSKLRERVLQIVKECTCEICCYIDPCFLIEYPFKKTGHVCVHIHNPPTDEECLNTWCKRLSTKTFDVLAYHLYKIMPSCVDKAIAVMYCAYECVENHDLYTYTVAGIMMWTTLTSEEWMNARCELSTIGAPTILRLLKLHEKRVMVNEIRELWYLDTPRYDTMIQWMPNELIDDLELFL